MVDFEITLQMIRKMGVRLTKQRLAFLEIIYDNHYTFDDLYENLVKRGHNNLATLYNNIDFFISHNILSKFSVNNVEYYELIINNKSHSSNSQIHFTCNKNNKLFEVDSGKFIDMLGQYSYFNGIDIVNVELLVTGSCKGGCDFSKNKVCKLNIDEKINTNFV